MVELVGDDVVGAALLDVVQRVHIEPAVEQIALEAHFPQFGWLDPVAARHVRPADHAALAQLHELGGGIGGVEVDRPGDLEAAAGVVGEGRLSVLGGAIVAVEVGPQDMNVVIVPARPGDDRQALGESQIEYAEGAQIGVAAILIPVEGHLAGSVQGVLESVVGRGAVGKVAAVDRLIDVLGLTLAAPGVAHREACDRIQLQPRGGRILACQRGFVLEHVIVVVGGETIA